MYHTISPHHLISLSHHLLWLPIEFFLWPFCVLFYGSWHNLVYLILRTFVYISYWKLFQVFVIWLPSWLVVAVCGKMFLYHIMNLVPDESPWPNLTYGTYYTRCCQCAEIHHFLLQGLISLYLVCIRRNLNWCKI